jgi:amino acid adenylation domain-containing protein
MMAIPALHSGFLQSSETHPARTALEVDGNALTYGQLRDKAAAIARTLQMRTPPGGSPLTGVFAYRSATTFAGILGALFAGRGYVPLNRTFPAGRTRQMLASAECRSLIVDSRSEDQVEHILQGIDSPLLILFPDRSDVSDFRKRWPGHIIAGSQDLESAASFILESPAPGSIAYLLFTSGSTGTPKGVMVTHANAVHFVRMAAKTYEIAADDRFSQTFDTTFDLSVFDMFVAWEKGACVCCPTRNMLLNPAHFIREQKLSVWFSVPSVATLMKRFGGLTDQTYASLRLSLFCGEPLPVDVAQAWLAAAPHSILENLYGPTELTVACSAYRWDPARSPAECSLGIVPIGAPFPGMDAIVVDNDLREVEAGAAGELLMSGPQLTPGYWRNAHETASSYVIPPGRDKVFYRTGDRVRKPLPGAPFTYLGRVDHQIKIFGHRVELGEVESVLRLESGVEDAVALAWPVTAAGATGIVAFLTGTNIDPTGIQSRVKARLQSYAVPHTIHVLPGLPQNANGKVDRNALQRLLEA